jgi:hypothetical protein
MATEQTLDTINNTNLKVVAETPSWALAQKQNNDISHAKRVDQLIEISMQGMIEHKQRLNQIAEIYLGRISDNASSLDPVEAISTSKAFSGESNSQISSLLAQLAAGQIGAKTAQSTPPTSATDTGFSSLLAMMNTLNQQNYSNNTTNSSLAATMTALASILNKIAYNSPPVGTSGTPVPGGTTFR